MDTTFLELLEVPVAICEPDSFLVEFGNSRFWEGINRRPVKVPIMALLKGFKETDYLRADLVGESYQFVVPRFAGDQTTFRAKETRSPKRCIVFQGASYSPVNASELSQDEVSHALLAAGEESFFLANLEAQQTLLLARTLGLKDLEAEAHRWMEESIALMSQHIFRGFLMSFQVHSIDLDFKLFTNLMSQEIKLALQDTQRDFQLSIDAKIPRKMRGPFPFIQMTMLHFYKALVDSSKNSSDLKMSIEMVSHEEQDVQLEFVLQLPDDPVKVEVLDRARDLFQSMFFKFILEARNYDILWTAYLVRNSGGLLFYDDPRVLRLQWTLQEVPASLSEQDSLQFDPSKKAPAVEPLQKHVPVEEESDEEFEEALSSTEDLLESLLESPSESEEGDEDDLLSADSFAQEKMEQRLASLQSSRLALQEEETQAPQDTDEVPSQRTLPSQDDFVQAQKKSSSNQKETLEDLQAQMEDVTSIPAPSTDVEAMERQSLVDSIFDDLDVHRQKGEEAKEILNDLMEDVEKKRKILVAEDNRVNQTIFEQILKRAGYDYKICENGKEAVEELPKDDYCMILMDLQMPEMNGFEAAQYIREKERETGKHIPIIAVSANLLEEDYEVVKQAGMDDFVVKPISRQALLSTIQKFLSESKE